MRLNYSSNSSIYDIVSAVQLSPLSDINVQDKKGNTALHVAVEKKNKDGVEFLVKHFARSDVLNHNKMAPLHLIVETGQAHLIAVRPSLHIILGRSTIGLRKQII